MAYVWYKLWPVGYRKLCTSCFTMISFVLHRLAMPWITDNGMSINKQNTKHTKGNRWWRILGVWRRSVEVHCLLYSASTRSMSTSRTSGHSVFGPSDGQFGLILWGETSDRAHFFLVRATESTKTFMDQYICIYIFFYIYKKSRIQDRGVGGLAGVFGTFQIWPIGMIPPKLRHILGSLAVSDFFFSPKKWPYLGQIAFLKYNDKSIF